MPQIVGKFFSYNNPCSRDNLIKFNTFPTIKKVRKNIESYMIPLCREIDVLFLLDNGDHHIPEVLPFWSLTIVKGTFLSVIQRNTARGFNCFFFSSLFFFIVTEYNSFEFHDFNGTTIMVPLYCAAPWVIYIRAFAVFIWWSRNLGWEYDKLRWHAVAVARRAQYNAVIYRERLRSRTNFP